jgi:Holliday junction resolvasome RuvABC endonuclease subunit
MEELIEENHMDAVVVEDVYYMRNAATHKKLSGLLYVLITWLYDNKIKFLVVTASQWRSTSQIKGKGRTAKKHASKKYVLDRFGEKVTNDESDAILIGIHAVEELNDYQWGDDAPPIDYVFNIERSDV